MPCNTYSVFTDLTDLRASCFVLGYIAEILNLPLNYGSIKMPPGPNFTVVRLVVWSMWLTDCVSQSIATGMLHKMNQSWDFWWFKLFGCITFSKKNLYVFHTLVPVSINYVNSSCYSIELWFLFKLLIYYLKILCKY